MMTAKEIRDALESLYPDVTDSEFNLAYSGFAHEHPQIAIGVVLISAIVLGTTDYRQAQRLRERPPSRRDRDCQVNP